MGIVTPQEQLETAVVLANATEIITAVINDIAGNDLSTCVGGEVMEGDVLSDTIAASIQRHLNPFTV